MSAYQMEEDFQRKLSIPQTSKLSDSEAGYTQVKSYSGIPSNYQDQASYIRSNDERKVSHNSYDQLADHGRSNDYTSSTTHMSPDTGYNVTGSRNIPGLDSKRSQPYSTLEQSNIMSSPSHGSNRFEVRVSPLPKASYPYHGSPDRGSPTTRSAAYSADKGYAAVDSYSGKGRYGADTSHLSPRRSPSPYRDRSEAHGNMPSYGYRDNQNYPEPAESRLVYTGPVNTNNFNYAQSRNVGGSSPSPLGSPKIPSYSKVTPRADLSSKPVPSPPSKSPYYSPKPSDSISYRDERQYPIRSVLDSNSPIDGVETKGKEAEVDALTSLLMQNMEAAADPDFFGMCAKCARAIMGEDAGCKALDQLFHVDCFTCISCSAGLKGRPFYAMEGKPYCEGCYINTLEKCSVCSEPITDRIVRATGKPYHSKCFVCVMCKKSLEGIPFTVDSANEIHCIQDFHRKFAPRCCVCDLPIMPKEGEEEAVRIVAMDRSFHMECYKCEDCGLVLSSEAEGRGCYPLDEHILCKTCNAHRIQKLTSKMTTEL